MIEEAMAGKDFLSGLGGDEIINGDKEPVLGKRFEDGLSDRLPESWPRDLRGGHESIEPSPGDVRETKDCVQASEQVGCFGRGKGDDGQDGIYEPLATFIIFF